LHCILSLSLNSCCNPLNNYMVFNDTDGLYTYTFEAERKVTFKVSFWQGWVIQKPVNTNPGF